MTRMTRPDCAVMCNLINTHTHTHIHTHKRGNAAREPAQSVVEARRKAGGSRVPGTTKHRRNNMDTVEADSNQTSETGTRKWRGECRTLEDSRGAVERVNFL